MNSIKEKNVVVWVLLSIVTCGIAGLVWYVSMTDDMGRASDAQDWTGGKALVFTLLTCGIYSIYWAYKMGKLTQVALAKYG